jgi:signal transduction histidine kinase
MEIRKKLTSQFLGIVAIILLFASLAIYISFSTSRKEEFYGRLESKTKLIAQMLIDIEGIDTEMLRRIERNNPLSLPNEKIIIFDYQNNMIYSTDEWKLLNITNEHINKVRLNGQIRLIQKPYEVFGGFYTGEFERIVVFAAARDIYGFSKLKRLQLILLFVFFTSLAIVYFAGRIYAARALQPITDIISQVDGINVSNLNQRIEEGNGKDELARLAKTFNGMLERIESAFKIQKNFIANASHELRTPLTVITGQLEVTLLKEREKDEYSNAVKSVLEDIKNLNQLSNRLLLLAQASSETSEATFATTRIDDALWNARSEILKRKMSYTINITFTERIDDEKKLIVNGSDLLLKTAISNLLDNACKYSNNKTSDVLVDTDGSNIILQFNDNGMGIPSDELSLIFIPFHRAKNSTGEKGHGLGLSIVEKIVKQHGGTIQVSSTINVGSEFKVTLPLYS